MTKQFIEEQQKIARERFNEYFFDCDHSLNQTQVDHILIALFEPIISQTILATEEEIRKRLEKKFSSFLLTDWSGENEVYTEINRLKNDLLSTLTPKK